MQALQARSKCFAPYLRVKIFDRQRPRYHIVCNHLSNMRWRCKGIQTERDIGKTLPLVMAILHLAIVLVQLFLGLEIRACHIGQDQVIWVHGREALIALCVPWRWLGLRPVGSWC